MALDQRWKNPQGATPQQLYLWAQDLIKELRKSDYLSGMVHLDADPVNGDIIYRTGGEWERLPIGSANQLLTVSSSLPAWVTPATPATPMGTLLTSGTLTNAATLDIVLTSYTAYRGITFMLSTWIPVTDDMDLWMRLSTDGGSTYDSGATNYRYCSWVHNEGGQGEQSSAGDTKIRIAGNTSATGSISNTAAEGGVSTVVTLFDQTNTGVWPRVMANSGWFMALGNASQSIVTAQRVTAQDTDAVRFLFESGNISSGKYAVYGHNA